MVFVNSAGILKGFAVRVNIDSPKTVPFDLKGAQWFGPIETPDQLDATSRDARAARLLY